MTAKKLLHRLHLWAGLVLCLPLVLLGLTGSILVFEHELGDFFSTSPPRVTTQGEPRSAGEILAAARSAAPEGVNPTMIRFPTDTGGAVTIRLNPATRGSGGIQMSIDPFSLEILETRPTNAGFMRAVFRLHANLLIPDRAGRQAVGWLGVVMLMMGLSGLVLWWPRPGLWSAAFRVKWRAKGFRFQRDLHGATGIWGFALFLTVTFSGVYLAFPQSTTAVITTMFPGRDLRVSAAEIRAVPVEGATAMEVDQAIALARTMVAEARLASLRLPQKPGQPYRLSFTAPGNREGTPPIQLFIDPWAARVIEMRDPATYSTGERIATWLPPLHTGRGFGWLWRIPLFIAGFMPLLFAITGLSMWLSKRSR